jgi:hypothetical protein
LLGSDVAVRAARLMSHSRCGLAECLRCVLPKEGTAMVLALQPVVALIAGILILVMPRLLNYIVALYLIVIGVLGLLRM